MVDAAENTEEVVIRLNREETIAQLAKKNLADNSVVQLEVEEAYPRRKSPPSNMESGEGEDLYLLLKLNIVSPESNEILLDEWAMTWYRVALPISLEKYPEHKPPESAMSWWEEFLHAVDPENFPRKYERRGRIFLNGEEVPRDQAGDVLIDRAQEAKVRAAHFFKHPEDLTKLRFFATIKHSKGADGRLWINVKYPKAALGQRKDGTPYELTPLSELTVNVAPDGTIVD